MKKKKLLLLLGLFLVCVLYGIYRFFFLPIMYDAYENNSTEYENQKIYIKAVFFPDYDYSSMPILFAHYRDTYYLDINIKNKCEAINSVEIIDCELVFNTEPYPYLSNIKNERILMGIKESHTGEFSLNSRKKEQCIESFKSSNSLYFQHEGFPQVEEYSVGFTIPVIYKEDDTVEINLCLKINYNDEPDEIVNLKFGGKRNRYINWR